jgi:2-polyprenyl-6-methoxyphenol hydroxylase-like FAD-dependent oxidoreductase
MNVLIAGGGVAGSVTAIALQQAGIDATIFEAHPKTNLDVGSSSRFAERPRRARRRRRVGVGEVGRAADPPQRALERGRQPARHALPGAPLADGRRPSREASPAEPAAHRGGRAPRHPRRVRTGAAGRASSRTAGDGFADGSAGPATRSLGHGIRSVARRLIDPGAPGGRYVGLTNFGGITPGASVDGEPEAWHMIFGRRAFFGYGAAPGGGVVWFVNWPRDQISADERATTSDEQWRAHLAGLFTDDAGPAVELIRAGRLELAGDNTNDLPHVPVWHRGPIVIIGDAAHAPSPTSGQGASMAAEDGVVLAKALRDLPTVAVALDGYEAARRKRVEKIVAYGARGSSAKTPGRVGRVIRDAMLRFLFRYVVTDRSTAWIYDYRVEWDRRLVSPSAARVASTRPA